MFFVFFIALIFLGSFEAVAGNHKHHNLNSNGSAFSGVQLPDNMAFNAVSYTGSTGCSFKTKEQSESSTQNVPRNLDVILEYENHGFSGNPPEKSVKVHLRRRTLSEEKTKPRDSMKESTARDLTRIQTLYRRIMEKKNQDTFSRLNNDKQKQDASRAAAPAASAPEVSSDGVSGKLMATLESGVSLGSGEYFMDVFIGTPPKHYSLILDTGSDLNWIQCVPCYDCFEQNGPYYDPQESSSFRNIGCNDPMCHLVSSPDPPQPCKAENQSCPYFYWYGDSSNTTGDFALETFTVNLTTPAGKTEFRHVENVMFGCGHWNRGLFHGAAGLLGLGRGPLSFSAQLQSLYGHSFSYCLVDRNSDTSVSSKLIFGEDNALLSHPNLTFTSLVDGKENPVETFYYVQIKSVIVGGEVLKIPEETWNLQLDGCGGTIIDSGTTLSYFADPAYKIIKEAITRKVKNYPLVVIEDFKFLEPCYNVSGAENLEVPEFAIQFADGAIWDFPVENYFIRLEPDDVICLAILGTPRSALSIIGNYQQQNFHILYDTKRSRLGYAPVRCSDV